MPMDDLHSLDRRRVTANDAYRMYRAWAGFGWEMVARPLELSGEAAGRMAEGAARGLFGSWSLSSMSQAMSQEYANLAAGLLAVPATAARVAAAQFDQAAPATSDQLERALSGAAPLPKVQPVDLHPVVAEEQLEFLAARAGGEISDFDVESLRKRVADRFLLPARVLDASQAWASWFVPLATARALLDEAVALGHQPDDLQTAFEPVAVGSGDAMVSLVATDYRASDFGVLRELGLTLTVSPRGAGFPDPGQIFLRLIVTDPWSLAAARQIWGIRKDLWDTAGISPHGGFDVAYSADRVRFGVGAVRPATVARPDALELAFPRLGSGRSDRFPNVIYSMAEPHDLPAGKAGPVRSILRRSGTGEGMQFGGKVGVHLPESRDKGREGGCLCSNGMACLCDTLRNLRLDRQKPAANGWTEHMSGALEAPVPVRDHSPGNHLS